MQEAQYSVERSEKRTNVIGRNLDSFRAIGTPTVGDTGDES